MQVVPGHLDDKILMSEREHRLKEPEDRRNTYLTKTSFEQPRFKTIILLPLTDTDNAT